SGSLFTLFLHCPLSAWPSVRRQYSPAASLERGLILMDGCLSEAGRLLLQHKETRPINVSSATISCAPCCFASCSVAWPCDCTATSSRRGCYPTAHPALPDDLLDVDSVQAKVLDLAELFDASDLFCEAADYSRDL
uniref:SERTA domain-containing protein n=1 Tax=Macrostomum lignano TaxID=282301 RepID=A0A1I8FIR8_9PLAT